MRQNYTRFGTIILIGVIFLFIGATPLFAQESITVVSPNGDESLVVNTAYTISWTWTGTIDYVTISYSPDNFQATTNIIELSLANTGSYEWAIPDDISSDSRFKVRVAAAANPAVYDVSDNPFKIRSGIQVTGPIGGERWVTNEQHTISWVITGTVPYLTIQYSKDNFISDIHPITTTFNYGSYTWTIPDDKNENVKVRVCDSRDLTTYGQSPNRFKIDYYYITFNVLDDLTLMHLSALTFKDVISGYTEFPVTSPKTKGFPYGAYNIIFYRANYAESSKDFIANADKTFTIKMESSLVHNWSVMADFNYDPVGDDLYVTSWFMRDGLFMVYDPVETGARVDIDLYDQSGAFVKKLESTTPDSLGVFRMTWNNTGLYPGQTYLAKVTFVYRGKAFTSVLTLKIESGLVQSYLVQSYQVTAYLNFNTPDNRLETTSWLMLDGLMIPNPDGITISIHDQAGVLTKTLSSFTHDNDGAFRVNWDNPGLAPQQTYLAYVTIVYDGKSFNNIIAYSISAGAPTAQETPQTGSSGAVTLTGSSGSNKEYDGISWVPGRCGLMGIEALALIGILLWFKRRC